MKRFFLKAVMVLVFCSFGADKEGDRKTKNKAGAYPGATRAGYSAGKMAEVALGGAYPGSGKAEEELLRELKLCDAKMQEGNKMTDMEIVYRVFHSHESQIAAEEERGRYCRKGSSLYYHLGGQTIVQDKNILVSVDDSNHRVLVQKPGSVFNPVEQQANLEYLKAFTRFVSRQAMTDPRQQGDVYYRLELKDTEVQSMGMLINEQEHRVERIDLFYAHPLEITDAAGHKIKITPRMEVAYAVTKGTPSEKIFDTGRILQKQKKGFALTGAYSQYALTDYYHQKTR